MPWNGRQFKAKHNHALSPGQASKAAKIANAILEETGDEAKAIRIANAKAKDFHDPSEHGYTQPEGD